MKKHQKKGIFSFLSFLARDRIIKKQVKNTNRIVYGSQAIKANAGLASRKAGDWDISTKTPKRDAQRLQRALDKQARMNDYYSTPSKFKKDVHKVVYVGPDGKRGTKDDKGIVDFAKTRKYKFNTVQGIKYATLKEMEKDKLASLRDPMFAFRHAKDRRDLEIIRRAIRVQRATMLRKRSKI